MSHSAKVLAKSISPDGVPLTTMEVVMPRIILAEFNTHRMFSRNSASSRAIPVEKMIKMVLEHPYVPSEWPVNQKGMSASENLTDAMSIRNADEKWLEARDAAVKYAGRLLQTGIHKQITNRLLEPFMWHTVIVTATEWSNFFHLRDNPQAHPDIQIVARLMREAYEAAEPEILGYGDWHTPLIFPEDFDASWEQGLAAKACDSEVLQQTVNKISVARCARVSYLTHEGKRDLSADLKLHDDLLKNGHMSPFEHVARPMSMDDLCYQSRTVSVAPAFANLAAGDAPAKLAFCGNFRGWVQLRKTILFEYDILGPR